MIEENIPVYIVSTVLCDVEYGGRGGRDNGCPKVRAAYRHLAWTGFSGFDWENSILYMLNLSNLRKSIYSYTVRVRTSTPSVVLFGYL